MWQDVTLEESQGSEPMGKRGAGLGRGRWAASRPMSGWQEPPPLQPISVRHWKRAASWVTDSLWASLERPQRQAPAASAPHGWDSTRSLDE